MTAAVGVAVGILVCVPEQLVLLHLRGPENSPDPNLWAAIGGHAEPEDDGDLRRTLCRELREELGLEFTIDEVQEIGRQYGDRDQMIAVHVIPVASTSQTFTIREGRGVAWFPIAAAMELPNLAAVTRADLPKIEAWLDTVRT